MRDIKEFSRNLFLIVGLIHLYFFQLANALRSGNPEEYVSHLPVHQDGSCNGLQHYAALGRDKIGAVSVNLAPCKAPQVRHIGFFPSSFMFVAFI